ncbi:MAG: single-stranded-DNA-specific exonuclease RecJ, partial [Lachnospiraceae bacterium]|nr:single-stranded-DNA-specific exonuclease RecJ [Lachnospiraceae bacterium]
LMKDMDKAVEVVSEALKNGKSIRIVGDYDADGICSTYILAKGLKELNGNVTYTIPHRINDGYGINKDIIQKAADDGVELIITCDNGISAAKETLFAHELGIDMVITDHHEVPLDTSVKPTLKEILPEALAVVDPKRQECTYPFKGICGAVVAYKLMQALFSKLGLITLPNKTSDLESENEEPRHDINDNNIVNDQHGVNEQYKITGESNCNNKNQQCVTQELQCITEECKGESDYALSKSRLCNHDTEQIKDLFDEFLQFAALATVCDVMELTDENRIIVKYGLKLMENTSNKGMRALLETTGLDKGDLNAYHLGFVIGPCINATGRLDTAQRALELFFEEDFTVCHEMASELKALNDSRKNLTEQGKQKAVELIEAGEIYKQDIMVVYLPDVHESLAGIIAGRIREQYNKPAIVITGTKEGLKGSGRSIDSYDMFKGLSGVKDLFTAFGGHKLAAGLSLPYDNLEPLIKRLNSDTGLCEEDFVRKVSIDMELPPEYATLNLCEELEKLEPVGNGNSKPLFAVRNLKVTGIRRFGKESKCAALLFLDSNGSQNEIILFSGVDKLIQETDIKCGVGTFEKLVAGKLNVCYNVCYRINKNIYKGFTKRQLILENYMPLCVLNPSESGI